MLPKTATLLIRAQAQETAYPQEDAHLGGEKGDTCFACC
jgi:hypothetical protein